MSTTFSSPAHPPSSPQPPRKASTPPLPPEWPIERFLKTIGKLPAAVGRGLDRLAKLPFLGRVVRFFSSVWVGIFILFLLAAYIALGSGFASVRAYFEMTDLQFFDAWPMRLLLAMLALDLVIVTLRRIPLTLFKLGSWTVHIGILTLISGSVWYFSCKHEGSFRIYLNKSISASYDVTERALYAFPIKADGAFDTDHPVITPMSTLPIYYEHDEEHANPLNLPLPPGALGANDASVRVAAYYPFATLRISDIRAAQPGDTDLGPVLTVEFRTDRDSLGQDWLIANLPAKRVIEGNLPFSIEYLYHPTTERLKDLQTSFTGPLGLTVRIPKLQIDRTYSIPVPPADGPATAPAPIHVAGSPYTLTPGTMNAMPMLSKGYEGAFSNTLTIDVSRQDANAVFQFQRMTVFRFPELSPDFVQENGKMTRKQAGVDPDIQLIFQDATQTQAWIVEDAAGVRSLIVRTPDGQSHTQLLSDKPVPITVDGLPGFQIRLAEHFAHAAAVMLPFITPPEQRPRSQTAMQVLENSMIDVELSHGAWSKPHVYVPFSPYAQIGDPPLGQEPAIVDVPGVGKMGLLMSTTRRALPSTLTLTAFQAVKFHAAVHSYADYSSTLSAQDKGSSETHTLVTHLNNPAADHGLYYFQQAWDGDDNAPADKRFSVIGVGNRPGIPVMVIGAILIVLGIGYAFYAKPLLLKIKKDSLARWNAARIQP